MKKLFTVLQKISKSSTTTESKNEKKAENIKITDKVAVIGSQVLYNPIEGKVIDLDQVPEGAFSGRLLGDGFAIVPTGNKVYSPVNGEVVVLFPTKHAIVILTEEGLEVLIHIGINTASLKGEGFTAHVEKGTKVKKGDLLITFDIQLVEKSGKSIISPVIITNMNVVKKIYVDLGDKKALEKAAEVTLVSSET
jgi:glucose-specific phosphotransferase system IIA component